jgi:hypothetical protein
MNSRLSIGLIVVLTSATSLGWSLRAATCQLRESQTGRRPIFGTTVKAAWLGNDLYFAIRCDDRPKEKPNPTATRTDDAALWYGDAVE